MEWAAAPHGELQLWTVELLRGLQVRGLSVAAAVFQFQEEPLNHSSQVTRRASWVLPSRLH